MAVEWFGRYQKAMSIMPQPDWDQIRDIARRADEIYRAGALDRATWRALISEAYQASNGRPDLTAFTAPYAQSAWIEELRAEDGDPVRAA